MLLRSGDGFGRSCRECAKGETFCTLHSICFLLLLFSLLHAPFCLTFSFTPFKSFQVPRVPSSSSFFFPVFVFLHTSLSPSLSPCLTPPLQCFTLSPSFPVSAYAANQNRFPWGAALNIILNFSFLISAASFTLNLLPRAKKQHGIHETCRHHRKCDYSLSISLSILLSRYPKQLGNHETCSHLRLKYFSFSLSCLLFLSPYPALFFCLPSIPF